MEIKGSYVALLTPFDSKNRINEGKLRELVSFQIENGTDGLVPCGTTGESPTLSWDEHRRIIRITVEEARGRAQVIAGAGSNNTREAVECAVYARKVKADGVLIVNPYYNKPTQEGLFQHFRSVAQACKLPVVVYNIPGRTGVNVTTDTMVRLKAVANIAAVKEASGDINQISDVIRRCGDRLSVLSGDDALTLPLLAVGGQGVISVAANIVPAEVKALCACFFAGDQSGALSMHQRLFPLVKALFLESNPIPLREAMNLLGWRVGAARLPLTAMNPGLRSRLAAELKAFGLKARG